jgi:hypothetical protein
MMIGFFVIISPRVNVDIVLMVKFCFLLWLFLIETKEYANKMRSKSADDRKAAAERLEKMRGGSMKPELKSWIIQRLHILNGLEGLGAKEEL